jgi:hypothetical protein
VEGFGFDRRRRAIELDNHTYEAGSNASDVSRCRGLGRVSGKFKGIVRPVASQYIYGGCSIHIIPRVWGEQTCRKGPRELSF